VIGNVVPLVFDVKAEIYNREGINFGSLSHLESLGLLQFNHLTGFSLLKLSKKGWCLTSGGQLNSHCPPLPTIAWTLETYF
jgi:hypothetical protein